MYFNVNWYNIYIVAYIIFSLILIFVYKLMKTTILLGMKLKCHMRDRFFPFFMLYVYWYILEYKPILTNNKIKCKKNYM